MEKTSQGFKTVVITGEQIRAARAMVRIEQRDLAARAGVHIETVKRAERVVGPVSANTMTLDRICQALTEAGIEFIPANGGGPGVRLRKATPQ